MPKWNIEFGLLEGMPKRRRPYVSSVVAARVSMAASRLSGCRARSCATASREVAPESSARARRFANRRMRAETRVFARSVALSGGLEGFRFFARIVMPDRSFALICPTPSAPSPEPAIALRAPKLATLRSKTRVSARGDRFATRQRSPHRRDGAAPHRTVCYRGTAKRTGF